MSYKITRELTSEAVKWLETTVGVSVFKVVPDHHGRLDSAGFPIDNIIIFRTEDEHATAIRLKYPNNVFQDHMA